MKPEKYTVQITTQEAAYLCAILNYKNNRENALKQENCEFMLEFDEENSMGIWEKFHNVFRKEGKGTWYDCQHLFEPQIKEFKFSCDLETKTEKDQITIGCKNKSKVEWLVEVNCIINLGLEGVKKEGHTFTKADIDGFKQWLVA